MPAEYELVAVAVVPQAAAAPTYTELDPITAENFSYGDVLSRDAMITMAVKPENLPDTLKVRLLDLLRNPTEVWVRRNGVIVAAGPLVGYALQGSDTVGTLTARTFPYYLRYMQVEADLSYSSVDQWTIAKGLVDHYQALAYGNWGIDTSGVGTSGKTRDRAYLAAENNIIYDRLVELGEVKDGFEWRIDYGLGSIPSRDLDIADTIGTDKQTSVIFDDRNISSPVVTVSVAAGDVATDVQVVSTGTSVLTATDGDATLRALAGRRTASAAFDGITVQGTLDDKAATLLASRGEQLLSPASSLIPLEDIDVDSFVPGDTVFYSYDAGIGIQGGAYRVASKLVTVTARGTETVGVQFLPPIV